MNDWRKEFEIVSNTKPQPGDILKAKDGKAVITLSLKPGDEPMFFARAYVNSIYGETPAWYLRDTPGFVGLKVILMPRSRDKLIKEEGLSKDFYEVDAIKIVKLSSTAKALLGEIVNGD